MSSQPQLVPYQIVMEASYGTPMPGPQSLAETPVPAPRRESLRGNMRLPIGQDHAPLIEQPQPQEKEQTDGKDKLPLQRQT